MERQSGGKSFKNPCVSILDWWRKQQHADREA